MYSLISNISYAYKKVWSKHKLYFLYYLTSQVLRIAITLLLAYILKAVIDKIEQKSGAHDVILTVIYLLIIVAFIKIVCRFCVTQLGKYSDIIGHETEIELIHKFLVTVYINLENPKAHDENEYVKANSRYVFDFIFGWMESIINNVLGIISYSVVVISLSPFVLIPIVISSVVTYITGKNQTDFIEKNRKRWSRAERKEGFLYSILSDLSRVKDIKIYNMQRWIKTIYEEMKKERGA